MIREFDTKVFWVRLRNDNWVVAERRFSNRWFRLGISHICNYQPYDTYYSTKSSNDIVEIGEELIHD